MNKTGTGKTKPFNEFQNLCLDVLRASKGSTTLDGIPNVPEVSGSDQISLDAPTASTPSTSTATVTASIPKKSSSRQFPQTKERKLDESEKISKKMELLSSLTSVESERNGREKSEYELRKYSLLLDVIKKEQDMQLSPHQISFLRLAIDDNLNNLPTAHSIKNISDEIVQILYVDKVDDLVTTATDSE